MKTDKRLGIKIQAREINPIIHQRTTLENEEKNVNRK